MQYLTAQQVSDVIRAAVSARDKALLAVAYNCGLRRAEAALLMRSDFFPKAGPYGMLKVKRIKKKGVFVHEIPIWRRTSMALQAYLRTRDDYEEPMFLSRKGGAMSGQAVYYAFQEASRRAGIPSDLWHPHVLRHSIAVHLMNLGADLADVQEHLGHDSIDSTLVYAKVLNPRKNRNALLSEVSVHFAKF